MRRFILVLKEGKGATIGRERSDAGFRRDEFQAVRFQLHVADDVGANRSGSVRQRGATEAGMEFIGDGSAADLQSAFENERLESGFGEVERGDQPVVAAADHDDVARSEFSVCAHRVHSTDAGRKRLATAGCGIGSRDPFDKLRAGSSTAVVLRP